MPIPTPHIDNIVRTVIKIRPFSPVFQQSVELFYYQLNAALNIYFFEEELSSLASNDED